MKYSRRHVLSLLAGNLALIIAPKASTQDTTADLYTADELRDIVGPVALYPDSLLGHVLAASTMPEQISTALSRLEANNGVPDENDGELAALDENIQALLPFQDVLELLQDNQDWRAELGYAVSVQQGDVLDAIQAFRQSAEESGNLQSNDHMTVTRDGTTILIQQADPQVVYVPVYQPAQVIVRQPEPVLTFTAGILVGSFIWSGWRWGWGRPYYRSRYLSGRRGHRWRYRGYRPMRPPHRPNRPHRPVFRPKPNRPRPPHRPGGNRPGSGWRPNRPGGGRPPSGNRPKPDLRPPGGRPPAGNRPKPGGGNRPGSGLKPGGGRPGSRPSARPALRPAPRPGISARKKGGAFEGIARGHKSSRRASNRGSMSRGKASHHSSRKRGR